jgi:integration host factor subunit alpha
MALTKASIVDLMTDELGFMRKQSAAAVETLLEIMKSALASGDDVLVSNFGKFCVRDKKERMGRNPATGEDKMLRARRVVTFKCSGRLRDRINYKKSLPEG